MSDGEKTVRIQIDVPLSLVARLDRLHQGRGGDAGAKTHTWLRALARGAAALEAGDDDESIITAVNRPLVPEDEAERVVLRGDHLAYGTRAGPDRRDDERGLDVGRRSEDHHRVRRAFIDRVMDWHDEGRPAADIAEALNEEGVRTARGNAWSEAAIEQLIHLEMQKRARGEWQEGE